MGRGKGGNFPAGFPEISSLLGFLMISSVPVHERIFCVEKGEDVLGEKAGVVLFGRMSFLQMAKERER